MQAIFIEIKTNMSGHVNCLMQKHNSLWNPNKQAQNKQNRLKILICVLHEMFNYEIIFYWEAEKSVMCIFILNITH